MEKLQSCEYKPINNKWALSILFILYDRKFSYKLIKQMLQIPNTTLSTRLTELVKLQYLNKYVYGSISKPHYTEYEITKKGLEYINSVIPERKT